MTGLALTSVNKFVAYNIIDKSKPNVTSGVENLADHSRQVQTCQISTSFEDITTIFGIRFLGSDAASDEAILMNVLRILILSKLGLRLTNERICEKLCSQP